MGHTTVTMEKLVALAKQRGFVYSGSEIYGGLANSWDYGPLGVELKNNIRNLWWKKFVHARTDMVGLDAAIMMNPKVWEASGHVANFSDAMIDCRNCQARHRADHLIEEAYPDMKVDGLPTSELTKIILEKEILCPNCGKRDFTDAREFNQLFQTSIGKTEEDKSTIYLRGEIAQAMFVNFKNILETSRKRVPFGIASVGKVFRNEITPGNFTFRTLEFDLMEFEYFIREEEWEKTFAYWLDQMQSLLLQMGFDPTHTRVREHTQEELSHYSKRTVDIEYLTPFGWKELFGLAYRTDFDLKNHAQHSGQKLEYRDPVTEEVYVPHVVEPTFGLTRLTLMTMLEAYTEEQVGDDTRVVMKFHPSLAPYKIAVLPLSKKEELQSIARPLQERLTKRWYTDYDETQSIGKRYRRQDEIGTPYCVTVDFDSLEDKAVTIRDRDTMEQVRVPIQELETWFESKLS
ncbi:glycine--tRNA ligase [Candidatus Uhrbacteria bacterium]|nr:glycine--tRNA ligase [Candidatus Uhrbacteria bacterium]